MRNACGAENNLAGSNGAYETILVSTMSLVVRFYKG